ETSLTVKALFVEPAILASSVRLAPFFSQRKLNGGVPPATTVKVAVLWVGLVWLTGWPIINGGAERAIWKTVPPPLTPPIAVVPYRLPSIPCVRPANGYAPSPR